VQTKRLRFSSKLALVATLSTLTLIGTAACSPSGVDTGDNTKGDGTVFELDGNGRPILSDDYSVQAQKAATEQVDTTKFKKDPPYKIAAVVQGPTNGWGTTFDAVMRDAFEKSGKVADLSYVPWEFATENQVKGVDDAVAAGVDAILLTSLSRAGLVASVERAKAAGIPVITCLAGVSTDAYTAEVSRDIPQMGFATADYLAKKLNGKGNVVMLHGIAGADAAEFWKSGALDAFSQYPGIKVVAQQNADWSAAKVVDVMRTIIAQQPQIDAVWVGGLEMGPPLIDVFEEAGLPVPLIAGTNPTNGFLRIAIEKKLDFYVAPFPAAAAQECVSTVLDVLDGKTVQKYTDVIDVMDGVKPFGQDEAKQHYLPQFNDDFIGPKVTDDSVYFNAGFKK
jgi:ABC-type sugar transport system, periplasmic component